jgi:carbamate kinase
MTALDTPKTHHLLRVADLQPRQFDVGSGGIPVVVDRDGRSHGVQAVIDNSMGPKVQAACGFAERTGGLAGIGALEAAAAILRGERGTRVTARDRVLG